MKLISVALARSIWLVDANELNPHGRNLFVDVVPDLIETYKFKNFPEQGGDFSQGMRFNRGVFVNEAGESLDLDLTVWNDALAADTRSSTKDSDQFLEQVLQALPDIGLAYDPAMIHKKLYNSQLHVRLSKAPTDLSPKLSAFAAKLSSNVSTPFEFAAFEFWPDQTIPYPFRPVSFSLQRRMNDPLTENRYWSQAPLRTDVHLSLLEELESSVLSLTG